MPNYDKRVLRRKITLLSSYLQANGSANTYRTIIAELNILAGTNWTWNYLHLVNSGKLRASPKLLKTIDRLQQIITAQGTITSYEPVTVLVPKGLVPENTVVAIPPKKCHRKACQKYFIPRIHNQKYCSNICRKLAS